MGTTTLNKNQVMSCSRAWQYYHQRVTKSNQQRKCEVLCDLLNLISNVFKKNNCDTLRDLVPFVQFKKREKHPWRSGTCNSACNFTTKNNTPPWVFFRFLNCTNGTKSRNASHSYLDLESQITLFPKITFS